MTPRQLVNAIAGGTRNAWHDLWIRRPGETRWKLAAFHRLDQKKLNERGPAPPPAPPIPDAIRYAMALLDKANAQRSGCLDRRTDILPD